MSEHDPLCDAGPDDNGWSPPCTALTYVPVYAGDTPSCTYCWDREDNCRCQCAVIRAAREDERNCIRLSVTELYRKYRDMRWAEDPEEVGSGETLDDVLAVIDARRVNAP